MKAWTEPETFAFNGRFNQQRYVNIWPRPVQQPHPPVWIPGGGSVETWQWCAEMDYVYCYLSYFGYKAGQATMERLLGRDGAPRQGPQSLSRRLPAVRRRRREPRRRRWSCYARAGRVLLRPLPARRSALRDPARLLTEATHARRHRRARSRWPAAQRSLAADDATPRRVKRSHARWRTSSSDGYVIVGTPDEVAEQLARGRDDAERRPPDAAAAVRQHEQGADQVQHQAVRREGDAAAAPLFDEWEDRWWPKPMETRAGASGVPLGCGGVK